MIATRAARIYTPVCTKDIRSIRERERDADAPPAERNALAVLAGPAPAAVIAKAGSSIEGKRTGSMPAAVAASVPARNADEAMNAGRSRSHRAPIRPASAGSASGHAHGRANSWR